MRAADPRRAGATARRRMELEDWIDDDGVDYGKPIRLFVTIRKTGDQHGGRLDRHQSAGQGRDQ